MQILYYKFMFLQEGNIADVLEKNQNIKIPVGAVIRIGVDSILVDIDEKEMSCKNSYFSGIITGTINEIIRDRILEDKI